jgi:hypothetical protein
LEVCFAFGLLGLPSLQTTSSAQAKEEATSIAVSCQTEPLMPCRRPTKKQSIPTQLARARDVDVLLWAWVPGWLVRSGVAGDQPQALGTGVEAMAGKHLPNAVGRDDDPAPLGAVQLPRDSLGAEAGMPQREGDDPLLDHLR